MDFSTQEELFNRLKPALRSKMRELNDYGYGYLKIEDIWDYLKESLWVRSKNLALNEMVSDILNVDNEEVDAYFKERLKKKKVHLE